VRFPVGRSLLGTNQQRIGSPWSGELLRIPAYDRRDAQLEILNGFDSALFFHF
jgi:hypothetical protein